MNLPVHREGHIFSSGMGSETQEDEKHTVSMLFLETCMRGDSTEGAEAFS